MPQLQFGKEPWRHQHLSHTLEGEQDFSSHAGTTVHALGGMKHLSAVFSFQLYDGDILSAILLVTFVKNVTSWWHF